MRQVDGQDSDRRPPDRRAADEERPSPAEVPGPGHPPRVKEPGELAAPGIEAGEVGALVVVAREAGQGQVAGNGLTAVLLGDNVVDLERQRGELLGEPAVLAAVACPPAHQVRERWVHTAQEEALRAVSARRALEWRMSSRQPRRS